MSTTDSRPDHDSSPLLGLGCNEGLGPNALKWTCFHCGQECADAEAARLHFGSSEHQQPGCQIDLAEYRRMEEVNRRHCEEDTELHRALHRMECEHQQALRREEEAGYAKGLRDGRAEQRWVPVGEALPPEHVTCAVRMQGDYITTGWAAYWHGARTDFARWVFPHDSDEDCADKITHWLALPPVVGLGA